MKTAQKQLIKRTAVILATAQFTARRKCVVITPKFSSFLGISYLHRTFLWVIFALDMELLHYLTDVGDLKARNQKNVAENV